MPDYKCYPYTDPNAAWAYCPSFAAAVLFSILFGAITVCHVTQAILYKKPFASVLIMGAAWETAGYIFRILSVEHQLNGSMFTAQQLLILLAPLWINAFVYMVLGRMVHCFLNDDRVYGVRARRITMLFVLCDITAFLIQATGGVMTNSSYPVSTQYDGLHVYMGGVGAQLFFVCIFIALAARFQFKLARQEGTALMIVNSENAEEPSRYSPRQALRLLYVVYLVLGLIIFRNIYRLVEYSSGILSNITTHEWYSYVFDAVPMLMALLAFIILHPGRILRGPRCDFSEQTKARKAAKLEKKQEKKIAKDAAKQSRRNAQLEKQEEISRRKRGDLV